jgi:hypothetical protein
MNKLANKFTVVALCLAAVVGLPACSCNCKKQEPVQETAQTPSEAAEAVEPNKAIDTTAEVMAEQPMALQAAAQPEAESMEQK